MSGLAAVAGRLRLGHISYSNCFPVHARFIDRPAAGDPALFEGTPAELNALLARGGIDAAPCSSIEYALHADRYSVIPDLVIGAREEVRSIILLSNHQPSELHGRKVAIPSASATSVVLLKILMTLRWGATPVYEWFDQSHEDPFGSGAEAALFIGDVALRLSSSAEHPVRLDLGTEWWDQTGLPFAFAVWQTTAAPTEGARLHRLLLESREYGSIHRRQLAERYSEHFRMAPEELDAYWNTLLYELDEEMVAGLLTFYRLAHEVGELDAVPELRWAT